MHIQVIETAFWVNSGDFILLVDHTGWSENRLDYPSNFVYDHFPY